MGKLHELIAVEPNIEKTYKKIKDETMVTFSKKPDHFMGNLGGERKRRLNIFGPLRRRGPKEN